nr:uncharacterized protein LOC129398079 [Pan paniscus]
MPHRSHPGRLSGARAACGHGGCHTGAVQGASPGRGQHAGKGDATQEPSRAPLRRAGSVRARGMPHRSRPGHLSEARAACGYGGCHTGAILGASPGRGQHEGMGDATQEPSRAPLRGAGSVRARGMPHRSHPGRLSGARAACGHGGCHTGAVQGTSPRRGQHAGTGDATQEPSWEPLWGAGSTRGSGGRLLTALFSSGFQGHLSGPHFCCTPEPRMELWDMQTQLLRRPGGPGPY